MAHCYTFNINIYKCTKLQWHNQRWPLNIMWPCRPIHVHDNFVWYFPFQYSNNFYAMKKSNHMAMSHDSCLFASQYNILLRDGFFFASCHSSCRRITPHRLDVIHHRFIDEHWFPLANKKNARNEKKKRRNSRHCWLFMKYINISYVLCVMCVV